ncbi:MAG: hypothetical protein IKC77_09530 [Lentisphaeria bacterium]|nr:hypothetical protein [Lentisphaeria bacterium]
MEKRIKSATPSVCSEKSVPGAVPDMSCGYGYMKTVTAPKIIPQSCI